MCFLRVAPLDDRGYWRRCLERPLRAHDERGLMRLQVPPRTPRRAPRASLPAAAASLCLQAPARAARCAARASPCLPPPPPPGWVFFHPNKPARVLRQLNEEQRGCLV